MTDERYNGKPKQRPRRPVGVDQDPPHKIDIEERFVGSLMCWPEQLDAVTLICKPTDMYRSTHEIIYQALIELHSRNAPIDMMLLCEHLDRTGKLELVGGDSEIRDLATKHPLSIHILEDAHKIAEYAIVRRLIQAANEIRLDAYAYQESADDLAAKAQQAIYLASEGTQATPVITLTENLSDTVRKIALRSERVIEGVKTGLTRFDNFIGSYLRNGDYVIVAGRPGSGKTSLALRILETCAIQIHKPALFISLEMGDEAVGERFLSSMAGIESNRLKMAWLLSKEEKEAIGGACEILKSDLVRIVFEGKLSASQIVALARREKRVNDIRLLIIDYIQNIKGTGLKEGRIERRDEVAKISDMMKDLGKTLQIPVIALAQLNRQPEGRKDHRPIMSDLKETGQLEADADMVVFTYRDEYYDPQLNVGVAELIIAKNRNGPTGTIGVAFEKRFARFDDLTPDRQREWDEAQKSKYN